MWGKKSSMSIVLIIACGFAAYINGAGGAFVLDDHLLIAGNRYLGGLSGVPHFFTENIASGASANWGFWRPLQMITYSLDYAIWKLNPAGYHLTNIFFHILAAICVWYIAKLLFSDGLIALLTGLLFVVNPLHSEAVTYISGRADPLASLFMLAGLIFYCRYVRQPGRAFYGAALAAFIAALSCRENSLIFPFLLFVCHGALKIRPRIKAVLPFIIVGVLYVLLRLALFNFQRPDAVGILARLPGFFAAVTRYARLLIAPVGLHMEYGKKLFLWSDWRVACGVVIVVLLFYAVMRARKDRGPVFFGLGFFLISLAPQTNLLYPLNAYMAEHWLYMPSIGIFLIVAYFLARLYHAAKTMVLGVVLSAVLIAAYGVLTVNQNAVWRNPVTLYETTLRYEPNSSRILIYLGNELSQKKDYRGAITLYKRAAAIDSTADVYFNLGNAHRLAGDTKDAVAAYQRAVGIDPGHIRAQFNLGVMLVAQQDYRQALDCFRKVLQLDPANAAAKVYVTTLQQQLRI
jgi:hypothetical protein